MTSPRSVLVINGPNLSLLGVREPGIYGSSSLDEINRRLQSQANVYGLEIDFFQSNHEGQLIDRVHRCLSDRTCFTILNPAGLTHYSVSLRDALLAISTPFCEVHLTDPNRREPFRHRSLFSDIAARTFKGIGEHGYYEALLFAHLFISKTD